MSKEEIRNRVWNLMEGEGVARFPGTRGRIPNFSHRDTLRTRCSESGEKEDLALDGHTDLEVFDQ